MALCWRITGGEASRLMRITRRSVMGGWMLAVWLVTASTALGQAEHLNKQTLIKGLGDRNMPELLEHLANTRDFKDRAERLQLQITSNELKWRDQSLPEKERKAAYREALTKLRTMIEEFPDRPRRPLWQTDYAERIFGTVLRSWHLDAAAFYEFGLPEPDQKKVYREHVADVYRMMAQADDQLFKLQRLQGRDSEDEQGSGRLSSVLKYRLFEQLDSTRLPYFHAKAAYYAALLPDDHPYFKNLGEGRDVPGQRRTPSDERNRLLQNAITEARPLINGQGNLQDAGIRAMMAITGRAMGEAGQQGQAIQMLNRAIDQSGNTRDGLLAELGKARALHRQGNHKQAYNTLEQAETNADNNAAPIYRLLAVEAHHRLMMQVAERKSGTARKEAKAAAFKPFQDWLADLDGNQAQRMRNFIFKRLIDQVGEDDEVKDLAPMERLAIARMSRAEGQTIVAEAFNKIQDKEKRQEKLQEAVAPLRRAIEAGQTFREEEPGLSKEIQAEGLYNLGMAQYYLAQIIKENNVQRIVDAGHRLVKAATLAKGNPIAKRALGNGVSMLRQIHTLQQVQQSQRQAYVTAVQKLFKQFPLSDAAENERLYYGSAVLEPAGKYLEAAESYNQVQSDHPDYFKNQRRRLMAMVRFLDQPDIAEDKRREVQQRLAEAARNIRKEAKPVTDGQNNRAETARGALGAAAIASATAASEAGNVDEALEHLANYENRFGNAGNLLSEAMRLQLSLLVEAGRLAAAGEVAQGVIQKFPDRGPGFIDEALDRIQQEIATKRVRAAAAQGDLETQRLREKAKKQARTAAQLAQLLVNWAKNDQGWSGEKLLPYQLQLVKARRLAGQLSEALGLLENITQGGAFKNNAQVKIARAEVLYAQGVKQQDPEMLKQAANTFTELIRAFKSDRGDLFWNAWSRRLQINHELAKINKSKYGRFAEGIPRRVKLLRNEYDQNLGGDPYRSRIERLENIYRAAGAG